MNECTHWIVFHEVREMESYDPPEIIEGMTLY